MLGGRGHGDSKQGGILSECLVFMKDFAQVCNLVYRVAYIDGGHADPRGMTLRFLNFIGIAPETSISSLAWMEGSSVW